MHNPDANPELLARLCLFRDAVTLGFAGDLPSQPAVLRVQTRGATSALLQIAAELSFAGPPAGGTVTAATPVAPLADPYMRPLRADRYLAHLLNVFTNPDRETWIRLCTPWPHPLSLQWEIRIGHLSSHTRLPLQSALAALPSIKPEDWDGGGPLF